MTNIIQKVSGLFKKKTSYIHSSKANLLIKAMIVRNRVNTQNQGSAGLQDTEFFKDGTLLVPFSDIAKISREIGLQIKKVQFNYKQAIELENLQTALDTMQVIAIKKQIGCILPSSTRETEQAPSVSSEDVTQATDILVIHRTLNNDPVLKTQAQKACFLNKVGYKYDAVDQSSTMVGTLVDDKFNEVITLNLEVLSKYYDCYTVEYTSEQFEQEKFGWKWFIKELSSEKSAIRDVFVAAFLIQLLALASPLATQAIVDKVISNQATSTLQALGVGVVIIAAISAFLSWIKQWVLLEASNFIDRSISIKVIEHLFRLPYGFFTERQTGVIINRIKVIEPIREFITGAFTLAVIDLPFLFVFLVLMLSYSWQLSSMVLAVVALMVAGSFMVGPLLRTQANHSFLLGAKVQGFVTENVSAYETVKSLQLERSTLNKFTGVNDEYLISSLKLRKTANIYSSCMSFFEQLNGLIVLLVGSYFVMTATTESHMTVGMLLAFQMFSQKVTQPLLKIAGTWQQYQQVRISVQQLGDVMGQDTENYHQEKTFATDPVGHIKVKGLSFKYTQTSAPLYENLTFDLKPFSISTLEGPSGCGKSTLFKMLQGFYQQTSGIIELDDRDIRTIPVTELRNYFGVVPQESVLFTGTIIENLTNGCGNDVTLQDVITACTLAGIHDTIQKMPMGYQTRLGERGTGVSGGQRQRLAIARALIRKPKVLLFDESISGLDDESANQVCQTIIMLAQKKFATILFISHKIPEMLVKHLDQRIAIGSDEVKSTNDVNSHDHNLNKATTARPVIKSQNIGFSYGKTSRGNNKADGNKGGASND